MKSRNLKKDTMARSKEMREYDEWHTFLREIREEIVKIEDETKRLEKARNLEEMFARYEGEDKIILSDEYYAQRQKEKNEWSVTCGFPSLDKAIEGFRLGTLTVVSAPTGVGKTTFCMNLMKNFDERGVRSLMLSYEVSPEQLIETSSVTFALPATLTGDTLEWIEKKIIEAKVKHNTYTIFIDHLHYISDVNMLGKGQNMSTVIGHVMKKLTMIAKRTKTAIFLVSHLTKTRFDEMPDMSDLRDSSFIAQYADNVIMLIRKMETVIIDGETYKQAGDKTIAALQKNRRNGQLTTFTMQFQNNELYELDETREI